MLVTHHAEAIYPDSIIAPAVGLFNFYAPADGLIAGVSLFSRLAPSGGDAVFDVNTHATYASAGVTIFPDQTQRPKILSGQTAGEKQNLTAGVVKGQRCTVDFDSSPVSIGDDLVCIVSFYEASARRVLTYTSSSLANNASEDFSVDLGLAYVLINVESDQPGWARLYAAPGYRTIDAARTINTKPSGDHGIDLDAVFTLARLSLNVSPRAIGASNATPPSRSIAGNWQNLSGGTAVSHVDFTFFEVEL